MQRAPSPQRGTRIASRAIRVASRTCVAACLAEGARFAAQASGPRIAPPNRPCPSPKRRPCESARNMPCRRGARTGAAGIDRGCFFPSYRAARSCLDCGRMRAAVVSRWRGMRGHCRPWHGEMPRWICCRSDLLTDAWLARSDVQGFGRRHPRGLVALEACVSSPISMRARQRRTSCARATTTVTYEDDLI